jgi:hypothetical protein
MPGARHSSGEYFKLTHYQSFLLLFFKKEALACVFKKIPAFAGMTAWSFGGR